jgi:hypothetical protein
MNLLQVIGPARVNELKKVLREHWNHDPAYNEEEEAYQKKANRPAAFNAFFMDLVDLAARRLRMGNAKRCGIIRVRMEARPPMPYETRVGGKIISEGVAPGFVGIVGTFVVNGRNVRLSSRQIAKPFYQYVPVVERERP